MTGIMKIVTAGLLILILIVACSGPERITREQFYSDGKIKERWREIKVDDTLWIKDGADTTFTHAGKPERAWNYRRGKKDGKQFGWYPGGEPWYEVHYKNDIREGKEIHWFKDGSLRSESFYRNGQLDGKSVAWYTNGQVREEINYVMGNKEGDRLRYSRDGDTLLYEIYRDNVRVERELK